VPIRPENRSRYPDDWRAISARIRFDRAGGRCECLGECGSRHHADLLALIEAALEAGADVYGENTDPRCPARHGHVHPWTGAQVVLTTAHLDHVPEHCDDENLRAMCQSCHLNYDRAHHAASRAARLRLVDDVLATD
jgi:hypothetical protein